MRGMPRTLGRSIHAARAGFGRGMALERYARVVLIGFSGTGKSTVGKHLAERLGWALVDTDAEIERRAGTTIPALFGQEGEARFRERERQALGEAIGRDAVVVATGGGAPVADEAWSDGLLGRPGTLVVTLDAEPDTTMARLVAQQAAEGDATSRPMLAGSDPLARIHSLKAARQTAYDRADLTLVVDRVAADVVADEIARLPGVAEPDADPDVRLRAASGTSDILIRPGAVGEVGSVLSRRWPKARRAWVVSDERVGALHGEPVLSSLRGAGLSAEMRCVPAGEGSKSIGGASALYDWMLGGGIERGDVVVALGGGVVGDLAGFVAATCLRGVGLVQVPTSLLAMVDSSVGGKTGINHAAGKNLIGAFYQPPDVVIDPGLLTTLPPRELACGWGEIVKHSIIQPSTPDGERADLARFLERNRARLLALSEPATTYLIRRNVGLKAAVVAADEREAGVRAFLNFGHTLGHAIEASSYALLHGEAVGLGMRAAARLGVLAGSCDEAAARRVRSLADAYGLPATTDLDEERVLGLLGSDKKRAAGRQRWVLPVRGGGVAIRDGVAAADVRTALRSVSANSAGS